MRSFFKNISLLIGLIIIDQIAKYLFFTKKLLHNIFIPTFNHGIGFWIGMNPLIVGGITLLFIVMLLIYRHYQKINKIVILLLLSWAIGNLIDRVILWWVRDFIRLWRWPVFNLADIMISWWVLLYCWQIYIKERKI